mgnify:FL=1
MEKHYRKYGNFKVALELLNNQNGLRFWQYFTFKSNAFWDYFSSVPDIQPNHRTIFADELVIEGDLPDRKQNYENSLRIDKLLKEKKVSHGKFFSGSKGYHYHIYFPDLISMGEFARKKHKEELLGWIFGCPDGCRHQSCLIKELGIDVPLVSGRHLIRLEYGHHCKTNRLKILLTHRDYGKNYIPKEVSSQVREAEKALAKWKAKGGAQIKLSSDCQCMKFFMSEINTDLRKRVAFFLSHQMRAQGIDKQEAMDKMMAWNEQSLNNHFPVHEIIGHVDRAYNPGKTRLPGCTFAKQLLAEAGRLDVCKGCGKDGEHKSKRRSYCEARQGSA